MQIDRLAIPSKREGRSVAHLRQQVGIALSDVEAVGRGVQRIQGAQLGRGTLAVERQTERARGGDLVGQVEGRQEIDIALPGIRCVAGHDVQPHREGIA